MATKCLPHVYKYNLKMHALNIYSVDYGVLPDDCHLCGAVYAVPPAKYDP